MKTLINLDQEFSILQVHGIDARTYLQGQLTNDINRLNNEFFIYALHLNNKGRALASFIITRPDIDTYYLIGAKDVIKSVLPRLKMYILRSKVIIQELNDLSLIYSNNTLPEGKSIMLSTDNFLTTISSENCIDTSKDTSTWHKFLIEQHIPFIYSQTVEQFIPQHISYDLIGGVSFTKGCYTGQEIVARTHYLGKTKKQMFSFTCDDKVDIGQAITSPIFENQVIGVVVDTILFNGTYIGLASIQIDAISQAFIGTNKLVVSEIKFPQIT